jgi:bifunctional non-homologous end joining protein LigD
VAGFQLSTEGFIEPMLLLRTDSLPSGEQWLYELKLDGYPAIAFKRNGAVHLRSRNDNDFSIRYPGIVKALQKLPENTVIDGEVLAFDEEGRPSFNALQNYRLVNSAGRVLRLRRDGAIRPGP